MAKKYKNFAEARIEIIIRAWKNPEFKAKLLKNPRAAFKEMGVDFPQEINVRVVEDSGNAFTFVLPKAVLGSEELSENQLQKIAGGACIAFGSGEAMSVRGSFEAQAAGGSEEECTAIIGSRRQG